MSKHTLEAIYKMYYNDVFRYIYSLSRNRELSEDVTQETFYRLYHYLDEIKDNQFKPWLFRVAYNAFVDSTRKEKRHQNYSFEQSIFNARSAEEEVFVKLQITNFARFANELSPIQRNVIILRDYYQFTYEEIQLMTGLSLPNVKVNLFRARKIVQPKMKGEQI